MSARIERVKETKHTFWWKSCWHQSLELCSCRGVSPFLPRRHWSWLCRSFWKNHLGSWEGCLRVLLCWIAESIEYPRGQKEFEKGYLGKKRLGSDTVPRIQRLMYIIWSLEPTKSIYPVPNTSRLFGEDCATRPWWFHLCNEHFLARTFICREKTSSLRESNSRKFGRNEHFFAQNARGFDGFSNDVLGA